MAPSTRRPRSLTLLALLLLGLQGWTQAEAAFAPAGAACECAHPQEVDCDCPHHRGAKPAMPACHLHRKEAPAQAQPAPVPAKKAKGACLQTRCAAGRAVLHLPALADVPRPPLAPAPAVAPGEAPLPPPPGGPLQQPLRPARPPPRA